MSFVEIFHPSHDHILSKRNSFRIANRNGRTADSLKTENLPSTSSVVISSSHLLRYGGRISLRLARNDLLGDWLSKLKWLCSDYWFGCLWPPLIFLIPYTGGIL